ncbi:hypothetical protein DFA_10026 [Cavenderia fasciculata]|uniref:Oxidoreductase n=1 Tax=Cavenderia fasciculata TaxID=261658 RepID=F4Q927_CACFS|nr:uncharacterized protein DFA_10026 [Cavenderia fasciculata]EGG15196.1 hypothetical protein DFA_10026 [Cavenderia fasciculata]|eukprot:XP_004351916.1 hypothetical protein DFA_10026 [Cavenderia fasciculata]
MTDTTTISTSTTIQQQYLLSTKQFKQFNENGYLIVDGLISLEQIDNVFKDIKVKLDHLESSLFKHNKINSCTTNTSTTLDERIINIENQYKGASIMLHSMFAGRLVKSIGDIMQSEATLDIIQQLLADGNISGHPEWNVRVKIPNNRSFEVPWHQDAAYLAEGADAFDQITVWIPLVDINDCNGPVELIPCKDPKLLPHKLQKIHRSGDQQLNESWYLEIPESHLNVDNTTIVNASGMKRGSALFFNNKIPHSSTTNISNSVRWTIDIRYQKTTDPSGFYPIDSIESKQEIKMKLRSDQQRSIPIDYNHWSGHNDILMTSLKKNDKKDKEEDIFKYKLIMDPFGDHDDLGIGGASKSKFTFDFDDEDILDESQTLVNNRSISPTDDDDNDNHNDNRTIESQLFSSKLENHCLQQQLVELTKLLDQERKRTNGLKQTNQDDDDSDHSSSTDSDDDEKEFEEIIDRLVTKREQQQQQDQESMVLKEKQEYKPMVVLNDDKRKEIEEDLTRAIDSLKKIATYSKDALKQTRNYRDYISVVRGNRSASMEKKEKNRLALINEIKSTGIRSLRKSKSTFAKEYTKKVASFFKYDIPSITSSSQLDEKEKETINEIQEEEEEKLPEPSIEEIVDEPSTKKNDGEGSRFQCHMCRKKYGEIHFFYELLCWKCANFNYGYRMVTADMKDRIMLVTGARVKIGYIACLKLLRAGATVLATSRFSKDTVIRYSMEKDFNDWKDRLHVYSLDLRDLRATEAFCQFLKSNYPYLSGIINNAAQTISRPSLFYKIPIELELEPINHLPKDIQSILDGNVKKELLFKNQGINTNYYNLNNNNNIGFRNQLQLTSDQIDNTTMVNVKNDDLIVFEEMDGDAQPEDKRSVNSWIQKLDQVPTIDMLEAHAVSSFSPFILNSLLAPMLKKGVQKLKSAHIINVSAMEGKFTRFYKSSNHPHTNMAKASMNMMTRTAALGYANSGIYLNSVDTGWITNENPYDIKIKQFTNGVEFQPPLDEIDGAARVLAPIFDGINNNNHEFGLFFKDYKPTSW